MTIQGAIVELQNLLDADDVPFYYKGGIEKVIETIQMEMADRKTENSSEKPNNCEDLQDWKDRMWAEAIVTEPTISKMEQVDEPSGYKTKPVEDEPQTDCETCRYAGECDWEPWQECPYAPKTEPQTDTEIAKAIVHKMIDDAVIAEDAYPDLRQKMHDAVDEYEPQTGGNE